jgi:phosphoglycolate phosphatase-like HAD superfamily hydrolase
MNYENYFFDCDGVILNSNSIKGDAFFKVATEYSPEFAQEATQYYKNTAGTPRIDKIHYFFQELLKQDKDDKKVDQFLAKFNAISLENLFNCEKIKGVESYLNTIDSNTSYVVSGAPQDELREILTKQTLANNFKEILGSPTLKHTNVKNLIDKFSIDTSKSVFFGDSKVDYESAAMFNIDFIFVAEKTEFKEYKEFFKNKEIRIIQNFTELL